MRPYPLLFHPLLKRRVWGGRRLASLGKTFPLTEPIGESWELADLPDSIEGGQSVIANGPLAGLSLRQAIAQHMRAMMGSARLTAEGGFPLLIKFLDAAENLSVQVHPDEQYVRLHPEARVKSEAWVVLDALPGALIYKGIRPEITAAEFLRHVKAGTVADTLIAVPARIGDCHCIPSGTCHALGAGVLVAEIQTPSDTTFRVFDWGRTGRELHLNEAMACIRFGPQRGERQRNEIPVESHGLQTLTLAETENFIIESIKVVGDDVTLPIITSDMPAVWIFVAGAARIRTGTDSLTLLKRGDTALIPAGLDQVDAWADLIRGAELLRVSLPSPLKGLIAHTCTAESGAEA